MPRKWPRKSTNAPRSSSDLIFQQVYAIAGIDVKNDLLPSFGDEFVYYGAPATAGNSLRGLTIINKLKDPQKAETAMTAVENLVNLTILQQDPNSKAQFHGFAAGPAGQGDRARHGAGQGYARLGDL